MFVCIRAEKMFGTKYFLQTLRVEPVADYCGVWRYRNISRVIVRCHGP